MHHFILVVLQKIYTSFLKEEGVDKEGKEKPEEISRKEGKERHDERRKRKKYITLYLKMTSPIRALEITFFFFFGIPDFFF